ncbi:TRAP transporter small permease [Defluviimonas sp. SAOS-178_SWC]|uniref:TRAP transporter small permease n=1 Tax=Defluviimonas sp. SAOS-178_SWC TaxID=3121287 RepID=UPI0032221DBD
MKTIDRALSALERWIVGGAMLLAVCILLANVFLRYTFAAPISWAEELAIRLVIWMVFVGCSILVREQGHLAIDLLPRSLSDRMRGGLTILVWLISGAFLAWLLLVSSQHTINAYRSGQVLPMLQLPIWLGYLAIPVGSLLMIVRILQHIGRALCIGIDWFDFREHGISE